jgi:hypothetical protein
MNELIQRLIERTGLPEEQARTAAETAINFLKEKLPAPLASQIDSVLAGGAGGIAGGLGGVGGLFGSKE